MPTIGQMLVKDKVISAAQLEEAIQNQVIFGGRLGTNLIELQYVDEDTLTRYLSRKHGVPTVDWTLLNRVKPGVLKKFSKKLAKSAEGFPLKEDGKDLYVVMTDPANLDALQEIRFATGKNVKPLVLPEVRVYDLLTRFYNIGREMRYIGLAMMYKKKKPAEKAPAPAYRPSPGASEQELKEKEEARKKVGLDEGGELMSESEFQDMTEKQYLGKTQTEEPLDLGIDRLEEKAEGPPSKEETPAKEPAPAPEVEAPREPAPPPPAQEPDIQRPLTGRQPYKEVAQAIYSILTKHGIDKYVDKHTLQEFLKLFVKNQLKNFVLNSNFLANWLIIEANVPVEWLEDVLVKFKQQSNKLGISVVLPGEPVPEPAPAREPAEPAPPAPEEVEPAPVEPPPPPAEKVEREQPRIETMEASAAENMQVIELSEDDLTTVEEAEEFVPEEEPEEEEEEEEYTQLTLDAAKEKLLTEVGDRRDISRIVLGFAKGFFKRSMLFTVRAQSLYGWDGAGPNISSGLAESILLPLTEPGVFQLVNTTKSFFLGPVQPTRVNEHYLKLLGGEKPGNVFIMPVVVNERVVYMFYGDNGDKEFVPVNAPEVQILAYQIPKALEMLIRRKKAGKPPE